MDQARAIEALSYSGASAEALEREHATIENAFDLVSYAVHSGADPKTVACLFDTVLTFSEAHFSSEEQYLNDRGYSDGDRHAKAHRELLRKFGVARTLAGNGQLEPQLTTLISPRTPTCSRNSLDRFKPHPNGRLQACALERTDRRDFSMTSASSRGVSRMRSLSRRFGLREAVYLGHKTRSAALAHSVVPGINRKQFCHVMNAFPQAA
jgi:hypothetical protein